jgi:hypothetical protein
MFYAWSPSALSRRDLSRRAPRNSQQAPRPNDHATRAQYRLGHLINAPTNPSTATNIRGWSCWRLVSEGEHRNWLKVATASHGVMNPTGSPRSRMMNAIRSRAASPRRESSSISVVSRAELSGCAPWMVTFADRRKDHRYCEILDDILPGDFEYRYLRLLTARVSRIRHLYPRFLKLPMKRERPRRGSVSGRAGVRRRDQCRHARDH